MVETPTHFEVPGCHPVCVMLPPRRLSELLDDEAPPSLSLELSMPKLFALCALLIGSLWSQSAGAAPSRKKAPAAATRKTPAPAPAAAPTNEPAPAAEQGGAPGVRGPSRIDFDDRLIQGQTNKSGAVYLYDRKELKIRSMIKKRENFRDEIVGSLYDS
jgi:hypothetical protein